jgi:hypothetical protein
MAWIYSYVVNTMQRQILVGLYKPTVAELVV